jgi:hypothetical protein
MARFAGKVGFGVSTEERPGVFKDVITERSYFGYVTRASRQADTRDKVNDEIVVNNVVEIVADAFASENIFAIRYVEWAGTKWKVPSAEIQHPRLLLTLGGVYNGPTSSVS